MGKINNKKLKKVLSKSDEEFFNYIGIDLFNELSNKLNDLKKHSNVHIMPAYYEKMQEFYTQIKENKNVKPFVEFCLKTNIIIPEVILNNDKEKTN